jgi:DNA-binding MarR family transcriptional regulator
MRADWAAMTDEQRKAWHEMRKALVARMTPEEREQMRQERRRMFESLSPDERKKWRDEMHRQHMDRKADAADRPDSGR